VRVARLDVNGVDGIFNVDKLKHDLPLQVGDPFNRFLLQASADTIVARLRNNGFPYAEVLRNFDSEAECCAPRSSWTRNPAPHADPARWSSAACGTWILARSGASRQCGLVSPSSRTRFIRRSVTSMAWASSVRSMWYSSIRSPPRDHTP